MTILRELPTPRQFLNQLHFNLINRSKESSMKDLTKDDPNIGKKPSCLNENFFGSNWAHLGPFG